MSFEMALGMPERAKFKLDSILLRAEIKIKEICILKWQSIENLRI